MDFQHKALSLAARLCAGASIVLASASIASAAEPARAPQAAPAPLPDWSGIWNPRERNLFDTSGLAEGSRNVTSNPLALFDASYLREYPPYRPDYEARYTTTLTNTSKGIGSDPTAGCLPPGFPRIMGTPYPVEFIVQSKQVIILFEASSQIRHIYTDGRPHPADLDPSFNGHSIGHWEGDTLVVDTVAMRQLSHFEQSTQTQQPRVQAAIETPVRSQAFPAELADKVVWLAGRQSQVAELSLNPPHMGTLEVRLSISGSEAGAQFYSPHPVVREAMEAAMPRLRELMAQAGISLGDTQVRDQAFAQRDMGGSPRGNRGEASGEARASILPVAPSRRGLGLVDLYA